MKHVFKILIVEDEVHNREVMTEICSKTTPDVKTATNGVEAFELIQRFDFDLVICDVRMPEMDGFELFDRVEKFLQIQGQSKMPRFAFVSAYGTMDDAVKILRKGAVHFLSKPLKKKDILSLIDEVKNLKIKSEMVLPPFFKPSKAGKKNEGLKIFFNL